MERKFVERSFSPPCPKLENIPLQNFSLIWRNQIVLRDSTRPNIFHLRQTSFIPARDKIIMLLSRLRTSDPLLGEYEQRNLRPYVFTLANSTIMHAVGPDLAPNATSRVKIYLSIFQRDRRKSGHENLWILQIDQQRYSNYTYFKLLESGMLGDLRYRDDTAPAAVPKLYFVFKLKWHVMRL